MHQYFVTGERHKTMTTQTLNISIILYFFRKRNGILKVAFISLGLIVHKCHYYVYLKILNSTGEIFMSRFVVITDGTTALNVRTGPSTGNNVVSTGTRSLSVGSEFTSLETRNVGSGSNLQRWRRIGVNRWVNEFQANGATRNCLAIQDGWIIVTGPNTSSSRLRVVNAPNGLNVRSAPFVHNSTRVGSINNNTTHNWPGGQGTVDPRQPANSNTRTWIRLGSRRWISASHVAAA